jgi:hypothetical protein
VIEIAQRLLRPAAIMRVTEDAGAQLYVEVINLLNRRNVGSLETELVYDPASDRPRVTTTRDGPLPLLPSFGVRFRF